MIKLIGNWIDGYAFDTHVVHSEFLGDNQWGYPQFNNTYSQMGQLVKKLKYNCDISAVLDIINLLKSNLEFNHFINTIDIVIPVPPSNKARLIQPVFEITKEISKIYHKKMVVDALHTTNTEQIKNIETGEKYEKVKKALIIDETNIDKTKNILIIDDLFDSGATINAYVDALKEKGYNHIYIFTLTKTRQAN